MRIIAELPIPSEDEAVQSGLMQSLSSMSLDLGLLGTGAPLVKQVEIIRIAARAFLEGGESLVAAGHAEMGCEAAEPAAEKLTGIALLYGPRSRMVAHYDSPTQPGRRREWLFMITAGNSIRFQLGDQIEELKSGDALIMDSMATLHGVVEVLSSDDSHIDPAEQLGLPSGSRLGVLLWTAKTDHIPAKVSRQDLTLAAEEVNDELLGKLFQDEGDEELPTAHSEYKQTFCGVGGAKASVAATAVAAAAAAKKLGFYRDYDYVAFGQGDNNFHEKRETRKMRKPDFSTTTLSLHPICTEGSTLIPQQLTLKHVRDPSTLHQFYQHNRECDLWSRIWSTSRLLAELILSPCVSPYIKGSSVVEIGAGMALCGLAAALSGGRVLVTDSSNSALELVLQNASLNNLSISQLCAQKLDWHHRPSNCDVPKHDILLGSDVLFLGANCQALVETILERTRLGGCALILDPGRPCADEFAQRAAERTELVVELREATEIRVLKLGSALKRVVLYFISVGQPTPKTSAFKDVIFAMWEEVVRSRAIAECERGRVSYEYTEKPEEIASKA